MREKPRYLSTLLLYMEPGVFGEITGLEALARYITKQQKNRRKWARSRNLKKPKQRTSDTKVSNARVKRLALDFPNSAKEIMEKLYPGYIHTKTVMRYSDIVDGAYIRCVMRKQPGRGPGQ